jgi:hypothetical protein
VKHKRWLDKWIVSTAATMIEGIIKKGVSSHV